jgi:uncharacterized protein YndB with AHSA1/START domain
MTLDVVLEEVIAHPVDEVWRALTSPESISEWLMTTDDFRAEVGARFRLRTQRLSEDGWVRAEVIELEPPRRMVWAWLVSYTPTPTTVTFELEPHPEGTRLRLTHAGEIDPIAGEQLRDGWPGRIELLRRSLD